MDFEDLSVVFDLLVFDADFPFGSDVDAAAPLFEEDAESWVSEALALDELSDLRDSVFEGAEEEESNRVLRC